MAKNETDLNKYKKQGKTLQPPFAQLKLKNSSWINDRMPNMLWAMLIIHVFSREKALEIFRTTVSFTKDKDQFYDVTHTGIASWSPENRSVFLNMLFEHDKVDEALRPLLLLPDLPALADWKARIKAEPKKEDWGDLADAIAKCFNHQSQEATDCRWVKVFAFCVSGKMKFADPLKNTYHNVLEYPKRGDQTVVRPSIRAAEIGFLENKPEGQWANKFWDYCYENTGCLPEGNKAAIDKHHKFQEFEESQRQSFMAQTAEIRKSLIDYFFKTSKTSAVDARQEAVFGLALYALGFFIESNMYRTPLSISGRAMLRSLFEAYITFAYLLKKEVSGQNLWEAYRAFGSGQANLIYRRYTEESLSTAVVDLKKVEEIANEDKWVEFVPINLGHWDASDLRKLSDEVGERALYGKYYAYTSGYLHGSWSAVRESIYQRCLNPLHRLHRIPAYDLPMIHSVTDDMVKITNKVLALVRAAYPEVPVLKITKPKPESKNPVKKKVKKGSKPKR